MRVIHDRHCENPFGAFAPGDAHDYPDAEGQAVLDAGLGHLPEVEVVAEVTPRRRSTASAEG